MGTNRLINNIIDQIGFGIDTFLETAQKQMKFDTQ